MKGMQKIKRGKGFNGVLKYALKNPNGENEGKIIGGNMLGIDADSLSSEFAKSRRMRKDIKKPVWHNSLRLPQGEKLSDDKLRKIGDSYMEKMGFDKLHQRVFVLHDDQDGQHIHIIASRISLDNGGIYLGQNENLKSTRHIQDLEKEFNLAITKGPDLDSEGKVVMPKKSKPSKNEIEQKKRTGEPSEREMLQVAIDGVLNDSPNVSLFIERLNKINIKVRPNVAGTGMMNGFSFRFNDSEISFTGSKLGKKFYSWKGLIDRGLDYDRERDTKLLQSVKEKCENFSVIDGEMMIDIKEEEKPKSRAHIAKLKAWKHQSRILNSPVYRLTLKGNNKNKGVFIVPGNKGREKDKLKNKWLHDDERFFNSLEIEEKIPFLIAKNMDDFDIYITPIDPSHHYILLDDTNSVKVAKLKRHEFVPNLIQETSHKNLQAVFKIPKVIRDDEQSIANSLMLRLNRELGDFKISGASHAFRLAGFSNRKPERNGEFVVIVESNEYELDSRMSRIMEQMRNEVPEKVKQIKKRIGSSEGKKVVRNHVAPKDVSERYMHWCRRFEGLARYKGWVVDNSSIDTRIVEKLLIEKFTREEVEQAIKANSEHVRNRPDEDEGRYAERAVSCVIEKKGINSESSSDNRMT